MFVVIYYSSNRKPVQKKKSFLKYFYEKVLVNILKNWGIYPENVSLENSVAQN